MKRPLIIYRLKKAWLPALLFFLMVYFIYHLIQGQYGLLSWKRLQQHSEALTHKKELIEEQNTLLQDKVNRLKPDQLDLDYVEELVREKVGVYHLDDLIVH